MCGKKIGDGDPADGSFHGGEQHDQECNESDGKPEIARGDGLNDCEDAEDYRSAVQEM